MNCPDCGYNLMKRTRSGDAMLDNRGLLLKGGRLVAICPKCKGDVPAIGSEALVLFFGKPLPVNKS